VSIRLQTADRRLQVAPLDSDSPLGKDFRIPTPDWRRISESTISRAVTTNSFGVRKPRLSCTVAISESPPRGEMGENCHLEERIRLQSAVSSL